MEDVQMRDQPLKQTGIESEEDALNFVNARAGSIPRRQYLCNALVLRQAGFGLELRSLEQNLSTARLKGDRALKVVTSFDVD